MKLTKFFSLIVLMAAMTACGGGGGSAGVTSNNSGAAASTSPIVSSIADYIFELDKTSIKNSGTDSVALSVTTLDVARNVVPNVPVSIAVDSGGVFLPATGLVTDALGKFNGKITAGGDKTDRIINATITVNGIKKTVTFGVTGSQISVTPVPAVPQQGETVTLNIRVADAANIGIANVPVRLSGSAGFSGSARTDLGGNLSIASAAPTPGTYVAVVSASGVSVSTPIRVVAPGGVDTSIPPGSPTFSGANLLSNPASIAPNEVGSTLNRSVLTAKFIRSDNSTVENMRVRFEIVAPLLGANEFISIGSAFAYSNSSGIATADYVSGQRTSPTNGVTIRMCFDYVDFLKTECPNSRVTTLTVNSQPLDISIGNFNKLEVGLGGIAYVQKFLVQVADASGRGVADAVVSTSLDITHFAKGPFADATGTVTYHITGIIPPTAAGLKYGEVFASEFSGLFTYGPDINPNAVGRRVWCVNEDTNRNGFKDAGEDINRNGLLEPSKSEIVLSYVNGNKTDANGQMLVQVSYPQNMGTWLAYTLKATTSVVGSQGSKERAFITDVLQGDLPNGSFLTPPYGFNRCIDSN
jgi:hypothetical protein